MSASVSAFFDELASSEPSGLHSSASAPPQALNEAICPSLLQIAAPQPTRPIGFGTGSLADHCFDVPAVGPLPGYVESDIAVDAVLAAMGLLSPSSVTGHPQLEDAVSVLDGAGQDAVKPGTYLPLPSPPLRSRVASRAGTPRRIEKGKRTPQACERCRIRKTKCNGARPSCARCTKLGIECGYVLDHKAVRMQLRKLQREGLLPETIDLSSRRAKSNSSLEPMSPVRTPQATRTASLGGTSVLGDRLAPEMSTSQTWSSASVTIAQGMNADANIDGTVGTAQYGQHVPQSSAPSQWLRAHNGSVSIPPRRTVPSLSSGSSSSSTSGYTPLVTPTEEGAYQLGDTADGFPTVLAPGTALKPDMPQQPVQYPSYPPPIMPYPGRSFPLVNTSGEYFDEVALLPELCGPASNRVPTHANGYVAMHGLADPSVNISTVWNDPSVPALVLDPGATLWGELFGRDH